MERSWWVRLVLLVFLAGCQAKPPVEVIPEAPVAPPPLVGEATAMNSLAETNWSELPASLFEDQALSEWAKSLDQSALYYRRVPPDSLYRFGPVSVPAASMAKACSELAELARAGHPQRLQAALRDRFRLFRSVGNPQGDVMVTGYYEALLHGSFKRSKRYFYPIYRRPPEALRRFDRRQIDEPILAKGFAKNPMGKLANRGLELVWVDNPIDAFFLHIQGSGRVQLDNGRMMRIGYDSNNGHPYLAIGKILIDEGKISKEEMTMPRLRQWLVDHPQDVQRLFYANASYVFFREMSLDAVGNINVPLTRERSIATDHRIFPKGAPAVLSTTLPRFAPDHKTVLDWQPEVRFVVNQDTGGAIRGAGRVDLFFGFGEWVEYRSGVMKQTGSRLYFVAPR
ncbi:MAG: MltA domain-containing protein [Magnetococcales bacterium]|nr:MltA domain-containing protein [Magnetococcales bacterium]